jgi:hypothetical protein
MKKVFYVIIGLFVFFTLNVNAYAATSYISLDNFIKATQDSDYAKQIIAKHKSNGDSTYNITVTKSVKPNTSGVVIVGSNQYLLTVSILEWDTKYDYVLDLSEAVNAYNNVSISFEKKLADTSDTAGKKEINRLLLIKKLFLNWLAEASSSYSKLKPYLTDANAYLTIDSKAICDKTNLNFCITEDKADGNSYYLKIDGELTEAYGAYALNYYQTAAITTVINNFVKVINNSDLTKKLITQVQAKDSTYNIVATADIPNSRVVLTSTYKDGTFTVNYDYNLDDNTFNCTQALTNNSDLAGIVQNTVSLFTTLMLPYYSVENSKYYTEIMDYQSKLDGSKYIDGDICDMENAGICITQSDTNISVKVEQSDKFPLYLISKYKELLAQQQNNSSDSTENNSSTTDNNSSTTENNSATTLNPNTGSFLNIGLCIVGIVAGVLLIIDLKKKGYFYHI